MLPETLIVSMMGVSSTTTRSESEVLVRLLVRGTERRLPGSMVQGMMDMRCLSGRRPREHKWGSPFVAVALSAFEAKRRRMPPVTPSARCVAVGQDG